jgi:predicted  nucleic acid-binding Zn-ribbon protein
MTAELEDKNKIISELKHENEYYAEEISQMKSIINDIKAEKTKTYEEKMKIIKDLNVEIENLKSQLQNAERINSMSTSQFDLVKNEVMTKLAENERLVENYKTKNSELEEKLKKEETSSQNKIKEFQNKIKANESNISQEMYDKQMTVYKNEIADKEAEIETLKNRFDELKREVNKIN